MLEGIFIVSIYEVFSGSFFLKGVFSLGFLVIRNWLVYGFLLYLNYRKFYSSFFFCVVAFIIKYLKVRDDVLLILTLNFCDIYILW